MRYSVYFSAAALVTSVYAIAPAAIPGMKIVWSDDFAGSGAFDKTKWNYYTGQITNKEEETYPQSGDSCKLSGSGSLLITPVKTGDSWASCRIETPESWAPPKGGKIEFAARFKLGTAGADHQGIWPAFWALGQSMRTGTPWPECGEIDTFENVNGGPLGSGTLHCGTVCDGFTGLGQSIPFDYGSFHTWSHVVDNTSGDWQDQSITWYMDGKPYHVIKGSDLNNEDDATSTMQKAMFITLNVAVGGLWPGPPDANTASGQDNGMEVQYVAVYEST
jgi:beta-glucanase (GH16 family)